MSEYVVSASGLALFSRCRKAYELGYERLLEIPPTKAMSDGTSFHAYAAAYACERRGDKNIIEPDPNDAMFDVFLEWARRRGAAMFDAAAEILLIEEPVYLFCEPSEYWLRFTPDLVLKRKDGWIEIIDYKTFDKAPTTDIDLDFQARLYITALAKHYNRSVESGIIFRHEHIRRCVPGTKNSKGVWSEEECYIQNDIIISEREAERLWHETNAKLHDLWECRQLNQDGYRWYRNELKGSSPHTCGSCQYKNLCKAELMHGGLDEETIKQYATLRKPLELPEGMKRP